MAEPRFACKRCGTWTCSSCGTGRTNTDVRHCTYPCGRCRKRDGILAPTMHTAKMWLTHNTGELPTPFAYGDRPAPETWPDGFGRREVPPVLYRGVPMPDESMDLDTWARGVDAALDTLGLRK